MAGQAILGETVLKQAKASEIGAPVAAVEETTVATIDTLVGEHTLLVFRIAYSILRNHHDAEDAAQECFLRAWKWRNRFQQVRNPKTWLARIAWTTALDRRSSRATLAAQENVMGEGEIDLVPGNDRSPHDQFAGRQMQELLGRLIAALPEDLRRPLELSTVQELNSSEIAEIMSVPESSIRTRLFRARNILKEKLAALEAKTNV